MILPEEVLSQQFSKFQEKLNAMAQHHMQALTMICTERNLQDVEPASEQVPWHQHFKGLIQRIQRHVAFTSQINLEVDALPDEDTITVIDASYTVVSTDSPRQEDTQ